MDVHDGFHPRFIGHHWLVIGERNMCRGIEQDDRLPSACRCARSEDGHRAQISEHATGKGDHARAEHRVQDFFKFCQKIEIELRSGAGPMQ